MKRVDEIVKNLPSKVSEADFAAPKKSEGPKAEAIKDLFEIMAINYPFFLPQSDDDLTRKISMWVAGLDRFDYATREKALNDVMRTVTDKGGPTIGEFAKLCSSQHRPELSMKQRLLPAPAPDASVREKYMEIMRNKDK